MPVVAPDSHSRVKFLAGGRGREAAAAPGAGERASACRATLSPSPRGPRVPGLGDQQRAGAATEGAERRFPLRRWISPSRRCPVRSRSPLPPGRLETGASYPRPAARFCASQPENEVFERFPFPGALKRQKLGVRQKERAEL